MLTVVEHLRARHGRLNHQFLYLGNQESIEADLCERAGVPFRSISSGAMRGMSLGIRLLNGLQMVAGTAQSLKALADFKPDVSMVTGGYVSVPPVIASWLRLCPVLIYLPDLEPGMAIKTTARFTKRVAVSFPEVTAHFGRGQAVVTGYPVRQDFFETDRRAARQRLQLKEGLPTLMIMGGSRGAQPINRAVAKNLEALLNLAQVIHLSGHWDITWLEEMRDKLRGRQRDRYRLYAYIHEGLVDAMVAADLVIARAGAATLAEFPAAGLPAILVPYPYSGQHQESNADYMVARGAAIKVADNELAEVMPIVVHQLLDDRERLETMRAQARALARPDAPANIVALLTELAKDASPKHKEG